MTFELLDYVLLSSQSFCLVQTRWIIPFLMSFSLVQPSASLSKATHRSIYWKRKSIENLYPLSENSILHIPIVWFSFPRRSTFIFKCIINEQVMMRACLCSREHLGCTRRSDLTELLKALEIWEPC